MLKTLENPDLPGPVAAERKIGMWIVPPTGSAIGYVHTHNIYS
jgi:hypothetical protein